MRRVRSLSLAAVLLLLLVPVAASAGKTRATVTPTLPPYVPPDSTSDPGRAHASPGTLGGFGAVGDAALLISLGLGGAGLLVLSFLVAKKARGPRLRHIPRRSFEAGRGLGRSTRVGSETEALERLKTPDVGQVAAMGARAGHVRVAIARRRGEPCELVTGYLTGLFEEAWASDVAIRHDQCSGKKRATPCEYDVIRVGPRAEEASTPRSATAKGRSPRAPVGRA